MRWLIATFLLSVSLPQGRVIAQEQLPPPRQAAPDAPPLVIYRFVPVPPPYHRVSAYDVWQHYAVDQRGFFRPRVIVTPYGDAFYSRTGVRYPWTTTQPSFYMPHASD